MLINNETNPFIWTIAEAKSKLSEILRKAENEPQYVGSKKPCVIISKEQWEQVTNPNQSMGKWLVENLSGVGDLELPDRNEPERETPFQ